MFGFNYHSLFIFLNLSNERIKISKKKNKTRVKNSGIVCWDSANYEDNVVPIESWRWKIFTDINDKLIWRILVLCPRPSLRLHRERRFRTNHAPASINFISLHKLRPRLVYSDETPVVQINQNNHFYKCLNLVNTNFYSDYTEPIFYFKNKFQNMIYYPNFIFIKNFSLQIFHSLIKFCRKKMSVKVGWNYLKMFIKKVQL